MALNTLQRYSKYISKTDRTADVNRRCSFQQVEGVAALQSSIRFLPHVVMGVCVNVGMAFFISRFTVRRLAVVSAIITMVTPPLMATIPVGQNYWFAPFWALFLSPANADGKLILETSHTHANCFSLVYRVEPRHLGRLPCRDAVFGWRRVQRGSPARQLCRTSCHSSDRRLCYRAFRSQGPQPRADGGLPGRLLDTLCRDGNSGCGVFLWSTTRRCCGQEDGLECIIKK